MLASRDPRFNMDPDERWLANIKGVRPQYSEYLRRGLGETLILFALFGKHARSVADAGPRIDRIVQRLLDKADRERWWSLSRDFQLLAEAAPETFLAMIENGLDGDAPVTICSAKMGGLSAASMFRTYSGRWSCWPGALNIWGGYAAL